MPAEIEIIVFWVLEIALLLFIIIGFTKRICSKNQSSKKSKENLTKNIFEDEKTPIDCNISSIKMDKKKLPPLPKPPQIIKYFLENDNIFALYDNNYVEYYDLNHTDFGWCKYFTNSLLQQQEFFENLDNLKEISKDEANELITKAKEGKIVDSIKLNDKECCIVFVENWKLKSSRFFAITMARILCDMGFLVTKIRLGGFSEWDTGHGEYSATYHSIDDFKNNAVTDYLNDPERWVILTWTSTSAKLKKDENIEAYFNCDEFYTNTKLIIRYIENSQNAPIEYIKKIAEDAVSQFQTAYNNMEYCIHHDTFFDKNEYNKCPHCSNNLCIW